MSGHGPLLILAGALSCALAACDRKSPTEEAPPATTESKPVVSPPAAAEEAAAKAVAERAESEAAKAYAAAETARANAAKAAADQGHAKGRAAPIAWDDGITWLSWEEARRRAATEKKLIAVLVYADWCPRCQEFKPVLKDPEVEALAGKLLMVRQDSDQKPAWLGEYAKYGSYVPRVLFIDAEGKVREDLTSGHPRYPYFYSPSGINALKDSLRTAGGA